MRHQPNPPQIIPLPKLSSSHISPTNHPHPCGPTFQKPSLTSNLPAPSSAWQSQLDAVRVIPSWSPSITPTTPHPISLLAKPKKLSYSVNKVQVPRGSGTGTHAAHTTTALARRIKMRREIEMCCETLVRAFSKLSLVAKRCNS